MHSHHQMRQPAVAVDGVRTVTAIVLCVLLVLTAALPAGALTRPNRVHAGDAQNSRRAADVGPRTLGVEWVTNGSEVDDYSVSGIEGGTTGAAYGLLVHEGLVIATGTKDGSSNDQATFAFDAETGDPLWITAGVGGSCKPAIDDDGTLWSFDRVAGGGTARALVAMDPATGELDPARRLESLPSGPNVVDCSYAIHIASNGLVVFFNGSQTDVLVAVDPDTAEVVWEAPAERFRSGALMTDPTTGDLITLDRPAEDATVNRIDPDDGTTLDSFTIPGREVDGQLITDDGQLLVSTSAQFGGAPNQTMRVDLASRTVVWQRDDLGQLGSLALGGAAAGQLVAWIAASPARLLSLDIEDGSTDWLLPVPGQRNNASILSDAAGTIYVSMFATQDDPTIASVSADGEYLGGVPVEEVGNSDWVGAIDEEGRLFATGRRGGLTNWLALTDTGDQIVQPGDPGVGRISGDDPIGSICQVQRPDPDSARSVLLARRDVFADALAGAPLAGDDSCILFTTGGADVTALDTETAAEIDRVLPDGGLVRILGGTNAVSADVEAQLRTAGYTVERYAGDSRYETALAIARQVRAENPGNSDIMLAFAGNWPDAVTGGAYAAFTGTPIVLTDPGALHPTAATAASELGVTRTVVLGGVNVVGDAAAGAMPGPVRVAGATRMATAVAVATDLWAPLIGTPTSFTVVNLERDDAYSLALAAAPLSAALGGPQLGVGNSAFPAETRAYLEGVGFTQLPAAVLVGDVGLIDEGIAQAIDGTIRP